jgi:hypothetical protein
VKIRPSIEAALSATADRLNPGSGAKAVRHAKNDLSTIEASSDNFNRRYADAELKIVAPVVFETKNPDGDLVTIKKIHEGLIVVYPDSFIFVRGIAFGAREVKSLGLGDVTVEKVTTVLNGTQVPGLRIAGRAGRPKFALAIAQGKEPGNPTEQAAVRDEMYEFLTR